MGDAVGVGIGVTVGFGAPGGGGGGVGPQGITRTLFVLVMKYVAPPSGESLNAETVAANSTLPSPKSMMASYGGLTDPGAAILNVTEPI